MADQLSAGSIETIMSGGEVKNPIVQVLGSKVIPGQGSNERYRLLISDGIHLNSFAMLATQLTPILTSGQLTDNSIIKILNHVVSTVKNPGKGDKRIMVILDVEIIKPGCDVGVRIGNPTPFDASNVSNGISAAPSPSQSNNENNYKNKAPSKPTSVLGRQSINDTTLNSPMNTSRTHPIASLSPYQNGWTIKARVTNKSNVRTWSNAKGEGKLFSVDLVDESGEIRATAFKEQVDKFYDLLEVNKVFFISRGTLKMANKKFSTLNNDYELTFNSETKIAPCLDGDSSKIPTLQFKFQPLSSIQDSAAGQMLDFIGVAKSCGEVMNLTSRTTNRELKKRDVTVVDQSLTAVTLTLWGTDAEDFNGEMRPVVAVKGAKVGEYMGGKTLSLIAGSTFQINPDIPEAHKLRGWFDYLTDDAKFSSLSSASGDSSGGNTKFCMLSEALHAKLGCGDKADYFSCYANLMHVRSEKCVYKACPTPDCQKKVIDQNNGMFRCEKCNREYDTFKYRLMVSANIADFSGNQWVTLFNDSAEELLGHSAESVGRWQEEQAPEFTELIKKVTLHPFQFKIRAKMENYNDESRLKMSVLSAKKPDYKEFCRRLITEIKEMAGISSIKTES